MDRRNFLALSFASVVGSARAAKEAPSKAAKVVKLFKSPDGHPNALETCDEGLWIGEQTTDRAHLVDWNGKLIRSVETESSNTSGIAYGGGFLWMGANGPAIGRSVRPTDEKVGAIVKVDPKTGKTVGRYPVPGGGGIHGLEFAEGKLWITSLKIQKLTQVDPKDFKVLHQIPLQYGRAHGLAWDPPGIWCMFSNDRLIQKLDARDGKVLEVITLTKDDPDPHGMCMYKGKLYYCDAGIAPGAKPTESPATGYVCRVDIA